MQFWIECTGLVLCLVRPFSFPKNQIQMLELQPSICIPYLSSTDSLVSRSDTGVRRSLLNVRDGPCIPVPVWELFSRLQYDLKIQYNIFMINPWSCLKSAELGHSACTSYRARPKFEKKGWPYIYDWLTVNSIKWLNWAIFVSTKTGARKRQYHQCVVYDKIWNILT